MRWSRPTRRGGSDACRSNASTTSPLARRHTHRACAPRVSPTATRDSHCTSSGPSRYSPRFRLWRSVMGFLDKVKDAAGKAADQAKHATAVGKEKLEDTRLQRKINDLCQEIGALVVAQRRNEAPAAATTQIDAKIAEVADLEKQQEANNLAGESGEAAAG